jgi:hypothetical protein
LLTSVNVLLSQASASLGSPPLQKSHYLATLSK